MDERQQKLNDTRTMLDWLEAHPNVPLPSEVEFGSMSIASCNSKEEALMLVKEFGSCEKEYDDQFFRIRKRFGSASLRALFYRSEVCKRVVVGTEIVPERVEPEHIREIVEWKCEPLLESEAA